MWGRAFGYKQRCVYQKNVDKRTSILALITLVLFFKMKEPCTLQAKILGSRRIKATQTVFITEIQNVYQLLFNVIITNSGLLFILKGKMLFPMPRLTIIIVLPSANIPFVYLGKKPWFGAIIPPINGTLICPPCACPVKIKFSPLFT